MPSCKICGKTVPTTKGLRFHVVQRQECRDGMCKMAQHRAPQSVGQEPRDSSNNNPPLSEENLTTSNPHDFDLPDGLDAPMVDYDVPQRSPPGDTTPDGPPDCRARVEDADDNDKPNQDHVPHTEDYPRPAGTPLCRGECYFERDDEDGN